MADEHNAFIFNGDNCIQCHGCEVACKSWRNVELGVKWRRVENIWEGFYPNVTCRSFSVSCMHCVVPACMEVCPEGAISKRMEDGTVTVDHEKCTGCRTCFEACPFDAPQFGADTRMQKCDMCRGEVTLAGDPPCVGTCPTGALLFMKADGKKKRKR